MTIGTGQEINYTDYNTIRSKVNDIFGIGSGTSGYGQTLSSSAVSVGDVMSNSLWTALRSDMIKARNHQVNTNIGTDSSLNGLNLMMPSTTSPITEQFRLQYDNFADLLTLDKFEVAPSQLAESVLVTSTRQTAWNGTLAHIVTISGSSAEHLRFFFNAGGSIKFSASRLGTTSAKNDSWTTLLYNIGTITMNHDYTISDGSQGHGSDVGFNTLTVTDQPLFTANALAPYTNNQYKIVAKTNSARSQVIMTIYFIDGDSSGSDQNVSGELISTVMQSKPDGTNVQVDALTATQIGFDIASPDVAYTISPDKSTVYEGESINFSINTNDVVPKTAQWTTLGTATIADFTDGALSGTVTISNNGLANIVRNIALDSVTETVKYFSIQLSSGGNVLATSKSVYLSDVVQYSITAVQTTVNEGGAVAFNITANVADGTILYWSTVGNTNVNDFDDFVDSGQMVIIAGKATVTRNIRLDKVSDGLKHFALQLHTTASSGTIVGTSEMVTINDTSLTPALYNISVDTSTINEGGTGATFSVSGGNGNDILYWTISGNIQTTDFTDGQSNGVITLDANGNGTIPTKSVINNNIIDTTTRYFTVELRQNSISGSIVAIGPSVSVVDSTAITASIVPNVSQISEGANMVFNVSSNAPSGTTFYWSIVGSANVTSADFLSNVGLCTINNGSATIPVTAIADKTTEGIEQFRVVLKKNQNDSNNLAQSDYVQIIDSSTATVTHIIEPTPLSVDKGSVVNFKLITSPAITTQPSYFWVTSTAESALTLSPSSGSVQLSSDGTGTISVTPSGTITKSGVNFQVLVKKNSSDTGVVTQSSPVTINYTPPAGPRSITLSSTIFATNMTTGAITSTITITLSNTTFKQSWVNTNLWSSNNATAISVQAAPFATGLSPSIMVVDSTHATFTFTGSASAIIGKTITDIELTFFDGAFTEGNAAGISNYKTSGITADFKNIPTYNHTIIMPSSAVKVGTEFEIKFSVNTPTPVGPFYPILVLPDGGDWQNDFIYSTREPTSFNYDTSGNFRINVTAKPTMANKKLGVILYNKPYDDSSKVQLASSSQITFLPISASTMKLINGDNVTYGSPYYYSQIMRCKIDSPDYKNRSIYIRKSASSSNSVYPKTVTLGGVEITSIGTLLTLGNNDINYYDISFSQEVDMVYIRFEMSSTKDFTTIIASSQELLLKQSSSTTYVPPITPVSTVRGTIQIFPVYFDIDWPLNILTTAWSSSIGAVRVDVSNDTQSVYNTTGVFGQSYNPNITNFSPLPSGVNMIIELPDSANAPNYPLFVKPTNVPLRYKISASALYADTTYQYASNFKYSIPTTQSITIIPLNLVAYKNGVVSTTFNAGDIVKFVIPMHGVDRPTTRTLHLKIDGVVATSVSGSNQMIGTIDIPSGNQDFVVDNFEIPASTTTGTFSISLSTDSTFATHNKTFSYTVASSAPTVPRLLGRWDTYTNQFIPFTVPSNVDTIIISACGGGGGGGGPDAVNGQNGLSGNPISAKFTGMRNKSLLIAVGDSGKGGKYKTAGTGGWSPAGSGAYGGAGGNAGSIGWSGGGGGGGAGSFVLDSSTNSVLIVGGGGGGGGGAGQNVTSANSSGSTGSYAGGSGGTGGTGDGGGGGGGGSGYQGGNGGAGGSSNNNGGNGVSGTTYTTGQQLSNPGATLGGAGAAGTTDENAAKYSQGGGAGQCGYVEIFSA